MEMKKIFFILIIVVFIINYLFSEVIPQKILCWGYNQLKKK
jgi:hypothetical protein